MFKRQKMQRCQVWDTGSATLSAGGQALHDIAPCRLLLKKVNRLIYQKSHELCR